MIQTGTCGYDYRDWIGPFYPEELSHSEFLSFYAGHFPVLELNCSFYQVPTAQQMARMLERTEARVTFAIKSHRTITHERTAGTLDIQRFTNALRPLQEAGRLGAILLQFPGSFRQTEENRRYISRIHSHFPSPVIEFRSPQWNTPAVWNWLKKLNVGTCCVDEPPLDTLMPPLAIATSDVAYVRFHGRNSEKWFHHNEPHERYDYQYSASELREWVPRIRQLNAQVSSTLVFFNNHFQAKAVESARLLVRLLET